jgi:uncharacterized membrane protein YphA (DoxX/SURF4 family)
LGLASIAAGVLDGIWGDFERAHQPIQAWGDHIPGRHMLAYLAAAWLIAGGAAVLWRATARAGAIALAGIYLIFALFWLPRFYTAPLVLGHRIPVYIGVFGGPCTQLIVVAGALILCASVGERGAALLSTVAIGRWTFGISSLDFGLTHLTDVRFIAGLIQKWMPLGGEFWAILSGIAFIAAGLGIVSGVLDVLAARLLALMLLIFEILVLVPLPIINPHDHVAWGANAYNLAALGATWIFAESLALCRRERAEDVRPWAGLMWRHN